MSSVSDEPREESAEGDPITLPDPDAELEDATVADARSYDPPTIETAPNPPDWIPAPSSAPSPPIAASAPSPSRPPSPTRPPSPSAVLIPPAPPIVPAPPILPAPPLGTLLPMPPLDPSRADTEHDPFGDDEPKTVADIRPAIAERSAPSLEVARSLDELQRWVQENRPVLKPLRQRVMTWSQRRGLPPWAPFAAIGTVGLALVLLLLIARC